MYPALVEFDRILSQVNGVMNAVEVESDFAGKLFFQVQELVRWQQRPRWLVILA